MPLGVVDHVSALWCYLLHVVEEFLDTGRGETSYPDQPLPVVLETVKGKVFFSTDETRVMVEPAPFLDSLLDEAQRFFAWAERNLAEPPMDREVAQIRERLAQL